MAVATRHLGRGEPPVTAVGLGLMGLSAFYGKPMPDEERFAFLSHAYRVGERFWDSADAYADNEDVIGEWFRRSGKRGDVFLATKFGGAIQDGQIIVRSDPEYVRTACEKSLRRLGVSVIDLYYCHRVDKKTPIEKTIEAMVQLKNEGKIRYLGLSEVSSRTLRRAHAVHPISAVQMEYSPFDLDVEKEGLLDACRELGVSLVAYGPLAKGMITAQYKSNADFGEGDSRRDHPRYSDENFPKNMKLVEHFKQFAAKKGCTPGQLSIAFLLAQGDEIIPIPGTQKIKYLDENLGALNVILTPVELTELRSAVDAAAVFGSRVGATSGAMSSEYHYADTPEL